MLADLHCHSRVSDGSLGIDEVVFFAKRGGLSFLALTDHDTMAGVVRAQVLGKRYGIEVIPGVEMTCRDAQTGHAVHLLCYLPKKPDRLEGFLKATLDKRTAAGQEMIRRLTRFYPVTPEYVERYSSNSTSIYRAHLSHALVDLGYDDRLFGAQYQKMLADGGVCRVRFPYPGLDEALEAVAQAQGIAVVAHPGEQDNAGLCARLAAQGRIQGVEAYHPRNSEGVREELLALCARYRLIVTGGTDFHGSYTPAPNPLGTCVTPPESIKKLFQYKPPAG